MFEELNFSGIYKIVCAASNKIYIGSSKNIKTRWIKHLNDLKRNEHVNAHLQNAYNKHGEENFGIEIIEYIMPTLLLDREQYWLDYFRSYNTSIGYNIAQNASAPGLGMKLSAETRAKISASRKGIKHSAEACKKISDSLKGKKCSTETRAKIGKGNKGKKHSAETCSKISIASKERNFSIETRAKIGEANGKNYTITSPDEVEIKIHNLTKFCRENDLNHGTMCEVAKGKRQHHKGWKCRYA